MAEDFYVSCYLWLKQCEKGEVKLSILVDALEPEYPNVPRPDLLRTVKCLTVDHKNRSTSHKDHRMARQTPTPQHDLLKVTGFDREHYMVRLYDHTLDGFWGMRKKGKGFEPYQLEGPPGQEVLAAFESHRARAESAYQDAAARNLLTGPPRRKQSPKVEGQAPAQMLAQPVADPNLAPAKPAPASPTAPVQPELPHPLGSFCSLGATLLQLLDARNGPCVEGTTTFGSNSLEFIGRLTDGTVLCAAVLASAALTGCLHAIVRMSAATSFAGPHVRKILVVPASVSVAARQTLRDVAPEVALVTYATTLE